MNVRPRASLTRAFCGLACVALASCADEKAGSAASSSRATAAEEASAPSTSATPALSAAAPVQGPPPTFRDTTQAGPAYVATDSQVFVIDSDGTSDVVFEDAGIADLEVEPTGEAFVRSAGGLSRISGHNVERIAGTAPSRAFAFAAAGGGQVWAVEEHTTHHFDGTRWSEHPPKFPEALQDIAVDAQGQVWLAASARGLAQWQRGEWQEEKALKGSALALSPDEAAGLYVMGDSGFQRLSGGVVSEVFARSTLVKPRGEVRRNGVWAMSFGSAQDVRSLIVGRGSEVSWEAPREAIASDAVWFTVDTGERFWAAGKRTVTVAKTSTAITPVPLAASVTGELVAVEVVGKGPDKLPVEIGPSVSIPGAPSSAKPVASASADKPAPGNAAIGGPSVAGGSVSNAGAVVAGMAAGFRRCYNKGLVEDPNMKGTMRVTAKIGPNGEVLSAAPSGGAGLSGTVTSCVAARVAAAQFGKPDGGGATIIIPVSFYPQ